MSIASRRQQKSAIHSTGVSTYSLWPSNPTPQVIAEADNAAVSVGVKFQSAIATEVTAIRFYKAATNTGTHTVSLWDEFGTEIQSIVALSETASGWQTVYFNTPVAISGNTTYVASYFAPIGKYSSNGGYFVGNGVSSGILSAPATEVSQNGLYKYSSTPAFPTESYNGANYWVDVVVQSLSDVIPPGAPSGLNGSALGRWASLTWVAATDNIGVANYLIYRDGVHVGTSNTTNFTDSSTTASTAYVYTVRAVDYSGNQGDLSNSANVTTSTNTPPVAEFTTHTVGRTVFGDGTLSSDIDGTIDQYDWVFGDGGTGTGEYAQYTYASDGTYTVQLTVTDAQGATHNVSHDVTVTASSFVANVINTPSIAGYPDETNTGVPSGTVLTEYAGSMTVTQNDEIVENLHILGGLTIDADNVIVRNCHIEYGGYYPIINYGANLLVEDCEIQGLTSDTTSCIAFGSYTARRCNMYGSSDGTKSDGTVLIEDCFIHTLAVGVDTHNDGTQTTGGSGVVIRHNTYRLGDQVGVNACIQFGNEGGVNTNWLVEDNIFDGGGWIINASPDPADNVNIRFFNNRFTRRSGYGVGGVGGATWFGNYYDDTGEVA